MKRLLLLCALLPFVVSAQNSLNTNLLYHWQDTTLTSSYMWDNVYNEIWGVYQDGREYAIIGSTDGTHIFDVTNPASSSQVAYIPGGLQGTHVVHRDYHDYQGYLYIVCDEDNVAGDNTFQIVDISDLPNSVSLVYESDTILNRVHNIFIDTASARLYTTSGKVLSLDNPANPTLLYTTPDLYLHDMYVRNDTVYANDGYNGFKVYDFSMMSALNQTHVELGALLTYADAGYNHSGWLSPDGNYYVMADENHGMKMKMIDMSDLSNMTVVSLFGSGIDSMSVPHNQIIHGNYVYTAHYHDGLYVHDISDPYNPALVAFYDTFNPAHHNSYMGAWGVYPFLPSGNILVSDMQTGLYVFEIASIDEKGLNDLTLFPNPTKDVLHMQFEGEGLLKIFDVSGKLLQTKEVIRGEVLSLSELPSGFYTFQLEVEKEIYHQKIIKQ